MNGETWYICREPHRGTLFVDDAMQAAAPMRMQPGQRGYDAEVVDGPMHRDEAFARYEQLVTEVWAA